MQLVIEIPVYNKIIISKKLQKLPSHSYKTAS